LLHSDSPELEHSLPDFAPKLDFSKKVFDFEVLDSATDSEEGSCTGKGKLKGTQSILSTLADQSHRDAGMHLQRLDSQYNQKNNKKKHGRHRARGCKSLSPGGLLFHTLPLEIFLEGVLPCLADELLPSSLLALTETCHLARLLLSTDHLWHNHFFARFRSFRPIRKKLRLRGHSAQADHEGGGMDQSASPSAAAESRSKGQHQHQRRSQNSKNKRGQSNKNIKKKKNGKDTRGKKKKKSSRSVKLPALPGPCVWKQRYRARYEEHVALRLKPSRHLAG